MHRQSTIWKRSIIWQQTISSLWACDSTFYKNNLSSISLCQRKKMTWQMAKIPVKCSPLTWKLSWNGFVVPVRPSSGWLCADFGGRTNGRNASCQEQEVHKSEYKLTSAYTWKDPSAFQCLLQQQTKYSHGVVCIIYSRAVRLCVN